MPSFTIDINFNINNDALTEAEEGLQSLRDSADDVSDSTENIDGSGISEMGESANETAESLGEASDNMGDLGNKTEETNQKMQETAESSSTLGEAIIGIGGAIGLDAMITKADNIQTSWNQLSLTFRGTGVSMDTLKAKSSELSAETGRSGTQVRDYFNQMGVAGITNIGLLSTSFENMTGRAYQTGTSVEQMESSVQRMVMSGNAGAKMLSRLGISSSSLAKALGVTEEEAEKTFKSLSTEGRLDALNKAMGDGTEANEMYKKSYAGLKEQASKSIGAMMSAIGQSVLPVLIPVMQGATKVIEGLANAFKNLPEGLQTIIGVLGTAAVGYITLSSSMSVVSKLFGSSLAPMKLFLTTLLEGEGILGGITAMYNSMAISEYIALAPLLAIIGAIILLGVAVYEVGLYFGWWTDVGTMIDSISAGLQRLWSAFINNPDVQAFIQGLKDAWNQVQPAIMWVIDSVMSFFGISNSGEFDIVRALIDGIGNAWNTMRGRIQLVIQVVQTITSIFQTVLGAVTNFITQVVNKFTNLPSQVQSALSGLTGVITKPFTDAWNQVQGTINNITDGISQITGGLLGVEYEGFNSNSVGYEGFSEALNSTISNSATSNSSNVTNNFHINGIIEETASQYIVESVNNHIKKQNLIRGV